MAFALNIISVNILLLLLGHLPTIDFGSIPVPGSGSQPAPSHTQPTGLPEDPATLREMLLASPHDLALLKERNPPLADALLSGSIGKSTSSFM